MLCSSVEDELKQTSSSLPDSLSYLNSISALYSEIGYTANDARVKQKVLGEEVAINILLLSFKCVKDPSSHRLIEKRRRDRFNTQLDRLKSLLPLKTNRKVSLDCVISISLNINFIRVK